MHNVRLHIAGNGQPWVLARCACGEVDKHSLLAAVAGGIRCKRCGARLDLVGATVEAVEAEVDRATGSRLPISTAGLRDVLGLAGLAGAAAYINSTVPHRYTAIFVRQGATLRNVALHDKEAAAAGLWAPFPVGNSFCSLVLASGEQLHVRHAQSDARAEVRNHPAAEKFQAYAGVPLLDATGAVTGALCHFDTDPVAEDVDMVAMLQFPRVLRDYLPSDGGARG